MIQGILKEAPALTRLRAAPLVPEREQFISHADANEMWRLQSARGDPRFTELSRAREWSRQMKERGELRLLRLARMAKFFERY